MYNGLSKPEKVVIFKEVGLPTAGNPRVSEYQQATYYAHLRDSQVRFVYFEAFDQPWKTEDGAGTSWGLFNSDRSVKVASQYIMRGFPPFYVYDDADSPHNHFVPEGFMGCWQGIQMDQESSDSPHSGKTAIKLSYSLRSSCSDLWAGIYWWDPPGSNWCEVPGGFDLTGMTRLTFWARGERGGEISEFKVGGLMTASGGECDSIVISPSTYKLTLTSEWQQYTIPLYGAPLTKVVGGFVWVSNSPDPITIYLDDIRYEWAER
jgi:hypothetical protein